MTNDFTKFLSFPVRTASSVAGALQRYQLAGYRTGPVYIRNSMHTPLPRHALLDAMDGRHESTCGYPAAGVTGRNLEQFLKIISSSSPGLVTAREDITIANAWYRVEYEEETGRTEASDDEVLGVKNIERLAGELAHITALLVFCGDKAQLAASRLSGIAHLLPLSPHFAYLPHLGGRGLSRIAVDVDGKRIYSVKQQRQRGARESRDEIGKMNTFRRLKVLAGRVAPDFERAFRHGSAPS